MGSNPSKPKRFSGRRKANPPGPDENAKSGRARGAPGEEHRVADLRLQANPRGQRSVLSELRALAELAVVFAERC